MSAWVGPAIIAAVISAIVTAAGWYASHFSNRRLEVARRRERMQDVQTALLAEIVANEHRLATIDLRSHADYIAGRIAAEGAAFTPFVPREVLTFVMDAIASEIHILPNEVIGPVVLYYRQAMAIGLLADDLRSDRFIALDPDRKIEVYRDYIGLLQYAQSLADDAIEALEVSLDAENSFSSRASARLAHPQA